MGLYCYDKITPPITHSLGICFEKSPTVFYVWFNQMWLVLKLHWTPEQVSSLLESVSQRLHSTGLHKFLETITVQTIITIYKTMDPIVIAFYAVELWHFSQECHDIVAAVWNLSKAMEQYQIFSGNFLENIRKYYFIGTRIYLSARYWRRDIFLLYLLVSTCTGRRW